MHALPVVSTAEDCAQRLVKHQLITQLFPIGPASTRFEYRVQSAQLLEQRSDQRRSLSRYCNQ
ncbi:hypothetical protein XAP412_470009 [Xanthomonas phaseoli pv. phaseoli]|uniref:Uncharacterized protein n=1 Tax=Xanthomonas campestris pv. phaseoli TaxID=317013 RepID=A0AB38E3F8_XANCH|nr:hypothetical protein XAP6984_520009 [Xanthomonas phaseoli pv. phaseoli]SON86188.1 hypothetical protein XAP412_470009 [Xanthomonas phaseoli pv. phaseoli]SON90487.1 hypothetical protein XAP7430_480057 [Xanthomonas phaseoli pv. phaseoli]SOO28183.1 hypothetical protein XAP6164_2220020 [Xanthomonas phaseoli pv. phaseoli]